MSSMTPTRKVLGDVSVNKRIGGRELEGGGMGMKGVGGVAVMKGGREKGMLLVKGDGKMGEGLSGGRKRSLDVARLEVDGGGGERGGKRMRGEVREGKEESYLAWDGERGGERIPLDGDGEVSLYITFISQEILANPK